MRCRTGPGARRILGNVNDEVKATRRCVRHEGRIPGGDHFQSDNWANITYCYLEKSEILTQTMRHICFQTTVTVFHLIQSACNLKRANLAKARDAKSSVYRVHAPGRQDCQTTYLTTHAREGVNTVDMLLTTFTAVKPCRFVWIVFGVSAQSLSWSLPDLAKQLQRESHSKRFLSPIDHPRLAD